MSVSRSPKDADPKAVQPQLDGVAFVCHPYHRGGVTRWMVDAAAEFVRRGVPVWFVAPEPRRAFASGGGRPTMASLVRELPAHDMLRLIAPRAGLSFELGTSQHRASVYARAISSQVPSGTPCIVSDDPSVWEGAANVSGSYPMVGVLHSDDAPYYSLASKYRPHLAGCVAVSQRIARRAAGILGDLPISVIPCGIPLGPSLNSMHTTEGPAKLIWVGRVEEEQKRVSDLLRISEILNDQGIDFSITIVGDGPARASLERSFSDRGIGARARFAGWQDSGTIRELMSASDVLLLPSNYEGTPVVMMEALAAGCAVVASRVSGVEDAAGDPITEGVVYTHDIGNVTEAARCVRCALDLPRAGRREKARIAAQSLFSIEQCIDGYAHSLEGLTTTGNAHVPLLTRLLASSAISFPLAGSRMARRILATEAHN